MNNTDNRQNGQNGQSDQGSQSGQSVLPPVQKIQKSKVIMAIIAFLTLFYFMFLLNGSSGNNADKSKPETSIPTYTRNTDSFISSLNFPKSYEDIKDRSSEVDTSLPSQPDSSSSIDLVNLALKPKPVSDIDNMVVPKATESDSKIVKKGTKLVGNKTAINEGKEFFNLERTHHPDSDRYSKSNTISNNHRSETNDYGYQKQRQSEEETFCSAISFKIQVPSFSSNLDPKIYLDSDIEEPVSPYQLHAGSIIPALLISGINSEIPGQIIGQVSCDVFDSVSGRYLLIPKGTKLLGEYNNDLDWNSCRIGLSWHRLIYPNGNSLYLGEKGLSATDLKGYTGLKGKRNNHYKKLSGAIILSTLLSIGSRHSQGDVKDNSPTLNQEIAKDVSSDINQTGQKIIDRQLRLSPTIEIKPGTKFNVLVSKDIILKPYRY